MTYDVPPNYGTEAEAVLYAHEHGYCVLGVWRGIGTFFPNGSVSWFFVTPESLDRIDLNVPPVRVCRFDPRWAGAESIVRSARSAVVPQAPTHEELVAKYGVGFGTPYGDALYSWWVQMQREPTVEERSALLSAIDHALRTERARVDPQDATTAERIAVLIASTQGWDRTEPQDADRESADAILREFDVRPRSAVVRPTRPTREEIAECVATVCEAEFGGGCTFRAPDLAKAVNPQGAAACHKAESTALTDAVCALFGVAVSDSQETPQ